MFKLLMKCARILAAGEMAYFERLCHNKWLIFDEK